MLKLEVLGMRDAVSAAVHDLIFVTAKIEQEVIIVNIFGREIRLYAEELWDRKRSAKNFIGYLKKKLNE